MLKNILGLFLLFHTSSALAETIPTYSVGVEETNYHPLYNFKAGGPSFSQELLETFSKQHHFDLEFIPLPVPRLNKLYAETDIDFKFPSHPNWESVKLHSAEVHFSKPILNLVGMTLVLKKNKGRGLQHFQTIGTIIGWRPYQWDSLLVTGEVTVFRDDNILSLLKHALSGHVDGVDADPAVAEYYLSKLGKSGELVFDDTLPHAYYAFRLSTVKYPAIIEKFNKFMDTNTELLEELKTKYQIQEFVKPN